MLNVPNRLPAVGPAVMADISLRFDPDLVQPKMFGGRQKVRKAKAQIISRGTKMSLKSRFLTVFTAAAATAALATFTMAQDSPSVPAPDKKAERSARGFGKDRLGGKGGFGRHGQMGMSMGRMGGLRGVQLTDAQKEQIKAIHQANKPTGAYRDELKAIKEARKAGTLTDAQKDRVKAIRQEAMANRKKVHEQILAVLTPEQKAQIEQRRNEMKQKREEFRQNRQELRQKRQQARPAVKTSDTI